MWTCQWLHIISPTWYQKIRMGGSSSTHHIFRELAQYFYPGRKVLKLNTPHSVPHMVFTFVFFFFLRKYQVFIKNCNFRRMNDNCLWSYYILEKNGRKEWIQRNGWQLGIYLPICIFLSKWSFVSPAVIALCCTLYSVFCNRKHLGCM